MAANTQEVAMDTAEDSYDDHAFVSDVNHFGSPMETPGGDHIECTEAFQCPITKDLMIKPVVLVADGTTYEESALIDWLSENNISPLTGLELTSKQYRPNYALQHAINDYLQNKKKRSLQKMMNSNNSNNSNHSNKNSSQNDYLGVGIIDSMQSSKVSSAGATPVRSPRSIVSSDMEIEEELVSYHSDEEKKDILLSSNNNTITNGGELITKRIKTTVTMDDDNDISGELDTKAAIKNAEFDKLQIFLANIDCGDYINIFIAEGFQSINDLYNITFPDLLAIGIPRGHGRRLLKSIMQHKTDINNTNINGNNSRNKVLNLGDPTMSIIDDGSIVDVSFYDGKNNDNENNNSSASASDEDNINDNNNNVDMKQSTMAAHNASIIIYPGKKLPKSPSAAPLNVNVLLLGDAFVGKTSLRKRLECNQFLPTHATQGVELTCLSGTYHDDDLQITVWDPAGQERYAPITKTFFRRAHGAAIVFSANDEGSWKHVTYWLNELETNAPDDIEVMLLCNKVDLLFKENDDSDNDSSQKDENETKQSELEDALIKRAIEVAQEKRIPFYMTSAKSGECVVQAFQELVSQIMLNEGIVKKIYEIRDGTAMRMNNRNNNNNYNNRNNGNNDDDREGSTGSNSSKKTYSLLNRLREQRRKYNNNREGIIDLSEKETGDVRSTSGCTCAR